MRVEFQIAGLIISILTFVLLLSQKRLYIRTRLAFIALIIITILCIILDIVSLFALDYYFQFEKLSKTATSVFCKAYLLSIVAVPFAGLNYLYMDLYKNSEKIKKLPLLFSILWLVASIVISCLPIDLMNGESTYYTAGPAVVTTYAICVALVLYIIFMTIYYRNKILNQRRYAILIWLTIWLCAALIQFLNNELLIVSFAMSLGLLIIYIVLENPQMNIDRESGLFNRATFDTILTQELTTKEKFQLFLINIDEYKENYKTTDANKVVEVAVSKIANAEFFKENNTKYFLITKTLDATNDFLNLVLGNKKNFKERFPNTYVSIIHIDNPYLLKNQDDIFNFAEYINLNYSHLEKKDYVLATKDLVKSFYDYINAGRALNYALDHDLVEVFYQPLYNTRKKQFTSCEALVRIYDEDHNLVYPDSFIPIAESNGSINKLGYLVFKHTLEFIKDHNLSDLGIDYIEVNLSVEQCISTSLADEVIELLDKYQIESKYIVFEITETASLRERELMLQNINKLKERGFRFALDDFGSGNSNLNYIVDMPVDIIKFDRLMVTSYFNNGVAKYVMDAAINMIQGMNLNIVLEGIETEVMAKTSIEKNILYLQGFYYSKPLPKDIFIEFITKNNK